MRQPPSRPMVSTPPTMPMSPPFDSSMSFPSPESSVTHSSYSPSKSEVPLKTKGTSIPLLVNASVTLVREGSLVALYIFGGFDRDTDEVFNSMVKIEIRGRSVNAAVIDNRGQFPGVRMGHTSTLQTKTHTSRLLIFGGENDSRGLCSDLFFFDIPTSKWTQPKTRGHLPECRSRHAAVLHGEKLYITGGMKANNGVSSDLVWLDLRTMRWSKPQEFVARYDHAAFVYNERIWVYGGIGPEKRRPSEIAWYDIHSGHRSVVQIYGDLSPEPPGNHFLFPCNRTLVEFVTSGPVLNSDDAYVAALDLDSFRWRRIGGCDVVGAKGYQWFYLAAQPNSTTGYLLGGPDESDVEILSDVLEIDLEQFGMLSEPSQQNAPQSLGHDWGNIFLNGQGADFTITALNADDTTSDPIHVHSLVLVTRWPHFRRLCKSQMKEAQEAKMHIPEAHAVVNALMSYFYTDSIASTPVPTTARLLVLANMYHLPRLRAMCVLKVSSEMDVENGATIWDCAKVSAEDGVRRQAAFFCLRYWGRVVRTRAFHELSKQSVLELCGEAADNGCVESDPVNEEDGQTEAIPMEH